MLRPLGEMVLVRDVSATDQAVIQGVDHVIRTSRTGIVVSAGDRADVLPGEQVVYEYCAGSDLSISDDDFLLIHTADLLAVLDADASSSLRCVLETI